MNQILITEKLYITPELKKKKNMYKIDFFISVFLVCILFSYYIYAEYDKNKSESVSKEILSSLTFEEESTDDTTIKFSDNAIVVILNSEDPFEVVYTSPVEQALPSDIYTGDEFTPPVEQEPVREEVIDRNTSVTSSGTEYYTVAIVKIPAINCEYTVFDKTTDELLKMSPCKFWGPDPNEVGNFCIVGHNYRNTKFFSKVPTLQIGETIELTDLTGRTIVYKIYDKYVVDPEDVTCTSQRTNGLKEVTIITCTNDSQNRVIVKAREII